MELIPLSVLIPTYNEELNLEDCLASVCGWAGEVHVVDSFSTDRTLEIAKTFGARIVQHVYEGHARQENWALENLDFAFEWVLIIDSDERVSAELQAEISSIIATGGNGCDGFYINRRFIFYGKWIKHCGWYPSWNIRLFKHRLGRLEKRDMHPHVILNGPVGYCQQDIIHEDTRDMTDWIAKHNGYATLEAAENFRTLQGRGDTGFTPSFFKGPVARKRALKELLQTRLPAPLRSLLFFCYMYFFRLGFLDGVLGFHFCAMHAFFEYFCGIKVWELKHYKQGAPKGGIAVKKVFKAPPRADRKGPEG